ncbi:MAG: TolC family protein, partial [Sphingomonas sp.]
MKHILLASLSALALSACAAGPDFKAPIAPPTATGAFLGSVNPAVSTAAADETWWRLYNDPVLDQLVTDALAANTDIRVAVAHLDKARASLRGTRSDRLPQANIGANGGYGRTSDGQRLPGTSAEGASYDVGLNISYEVDLAGRVRRSIEAARGDVRAADADADAVRVSVVAATTRAYVDAASSAERLEVAKRIVDLLDTSATLTGKRVDAGRAEKLDLVRITTLRDQRAALVPEIEAERQAALFRLATLTGRTPQGLP